MIETYKPRLERDRKKSTDAGEEESSEFETLNGLYSEMINSVTLKVNAITPSSEIDVILYKHKAVIA